MDVFGFWNQFDPKENLEGLQSVGAALNKNKATKLKIKKQNKKPELSNPEIIYLMKFPSYVTCFSYFHFFILKCSSYKKLAVTS